MKALLGMRSELPDHFFSPEAQVELGELVDLDMSHTFTSVRELSRDDLESVDILITAWGAPTLTSSDLDAMPQLRAIVHAAGAVRFINTDAWDRGILVSSAADANAVPVAEFTIAMITLAGKDAFWVARQYAAQQREIFREAELPHVGNFVRTIGIVGASRIGGRVLSMLKSYDLRALVYDPFCSTDRARQLGAELVADLEELAGRSTILSIHAPNRQETQGMISQRVLRALPDGATIINTARGELVDQDALHHELRSGRLRAILDVTVPEVLPAGHPFYSLPNVFITPHLAGAAGNELFRLGDSAVTEVRRLVRREPLRHQVHASELAAMA